MRRRATAIENAEMEAAIDAALAGDEGRVRFVSEQDREWVRLAILSRARRRGVLLSTRGRGRVGTLTVRRFDSVPRTD